MQPHIGISISIRHQWIGTTVYQRGSCRYSSLVVLFFQSNSGFQCFYHISRDISGVYLSCCRYIFFCFCQIAVDLFISLLQRATPRICSGNRWCRIIFFNKRNTIFVSSGGRIIVLTEMESQLKISICSCKISMPHIKPDFFPIVIR